MNIGIILGKPQVVWITGILIGIVQMLFTFANGFSRSPLKFGHIVRKSVVTMR